MKQPLSGVRILDLSRMVAAPWSTQLLGDLGAEVIKVERPGQGDEMHAYGPPFLNDAAGNKLESPHFLAVNRNKRSITVNLSTPEGANIIRQLAKISDVLVENFKVGDLKRYGLDYEAVRVLNPRLIYCSVTGFGQTGPASHRAGLDTLFQAMSGLMSVTGEADGDPQRVGVPIIDFASGMYATVGIMAALRHRDIHGGAGQHLDIALLDCALASMTNIAQSYLTSKEVPQRSGSFTLGNQPAGLYTCSDGNIVLSAGGDRQFEKLAAVVGHPEWATDPRYSSRTQRMKNQLEMNAMINRTLGARTRAEWRDAFDAAGVMWASVNNLAEAFEEPQIKYRRSVVDVEHPVAGPIPMVANPIRMSETPVPTPKVPPGIGQHTDEVLSSLLALSGDEVATLRAKGAI